MENLENTTQNETQDNENQNEAPKTYTEAEVQELLQKESDRRVTMALKKQQEKNANAIKEAQKLAAMNEQQKYEYQLEQREQAILAKEKELSLAENKNAAGKILSEKGISLDLVDFVVAEDAEEMNSRIKILDKAFKASVKLEVEKRLGSKVPTKSLPMDNTLTKEQFSKLSLADMQKLANEQPELFNELKFN